MNRLTIVAVILSGLLLVLGCSGGAGGAGSPVSPASTVQVASENPGSMQTQLWGYWDVYLDIPAKKVDAVFNRQAMFTANVVKFLNGKPPKLGFNINKTPVGIDYVDVDIDVSITHPFPGLTEYNGYDVRGVFMGDGSASLEYNPSLNYPVLGTDQIMLADPDDGFGGSDGYTRWYNKAEFSTGGMPLFQYTQGSMASPGFDGDATLCPYKYFADGLGVTDDLFSWLSANPEAHGVFTAGQTNTRNYYLRFPNSKGVKYGYAVLAGWKGTEPEFHPANVPEAVALNVTDNSSVYYVDPSNNGGDLNLDISVWDWDSEVSAGVMEDYKLIIESTILSSPVEYSDPAPIGGNENYSTYNVDIPADNVGGTEGNEYWIIIESPNENYKNDFGITNLAGDDPLAAFFRYDLYVSPTINNQPPVCSLVVDPSTPSPQEGWDTGVPMKFDASGSSDPDGDTLTYSWDFDGDGVYDEPVDDSYDPPVETPTHNFKADYDGKVWVKLSDGMGNEVECDVDVEIIAHQTKNIDVTDGTAVATDLTFDPTNGDILVYYPSIGHVRRYIRANWFENPPSQYNTIGAGTTAKYIDTNWLGYFELAYTTSPIPPSGYMQMYFYSPTGSLVATHTHGWAYIDGILDIIGFPDAGVVKGGLGAFMYSTPYVTGIGNIRYDPAGSGTVFNTTYMTGPYAVPTIYGANGPNQLMPNIIKAASLESDGEHWWWLEGAPDYTVTRWDLPFTVLPSPPTFGTYQNPGDADNLLYDPKDMARDNDGTIFILDKLSTGLYKIKGFDFDGSTVSPITGFGNSDDWAYTPIRLDGTDYDQMLGVLQMNGTNSYLSVFP